MLGSWEYAVGLQPMPETFLPYWSAGPWTTKVDDRRLTERYHTSAIFCLWINDIHYPKTRIDPRTFSSTPHRWAGGHFDRLEVLAVILIFYSSEILAGSGPRERAYSEDVFWFVPVEMRCFCET
jgi:hypothetical protein